MLMSAPTERAGGGVSSSIKLVVARLDSGDFHTQRLSPIAPAVDHFSASWVARLTS